MNIRVSYEHVGIVFQLGGVPTRPSVATELSETVTQLPQSGRPLQAFKTS